MKAWMGKGSPTLAGESSSPADQPPAKRKSKKEEPSAKPDPSKDSKKITPVQKTKPPKKTR